MASKPIPYLLRYIIELADLTVTCELHLQHLSLCIVPCGSDHRISQYVPSHCLLFSLSVSAFVIPDRNVLYYNAFSYIFSLKEFPLYTFTLRFCPTHYDNRRLFYFSLRFTLMQVLAYFLNTCAVSPCPLWRSADNVFSAVRRPIQYLVLIQCSNIKVSFMDS